MAGNFMLQADDFFIGTATECCWKCKRDTTVHAILVREIHDLTDGIELEEPVFLTYIERLNTDVENLLLNISEGRFVLDYSQTIGEQYFMNHCKHCGVNIGDFYLFGSSEAFKPWNSDLQLIQYSQTIMANSSYNMGSAYTILKDK